MQSSGYSQTPLAKKLGIKEGYIIHLVKQPEYYFQLFTDLPEALTIADDPEPETVDFIHLFVKQFDALTIAIPKLKPLLKKTGLLWISWPKGSSSIPTDVKRDPLRKLVLNYGLVDTKVCAVDQDWSGLKFVYRTKDR